LKVTRDEHGMPSCLSARFFSEYIEAISNKFYFGDLHYSKWAVFCFGS